MNTKQDRAAALTFAQLREANLSRCWRWHPREGVKDWSLSDWMTAVTGEVGELAGEIKMLNRERDDLPGNKRPASLENIAKEAADIVIYLDLLCASVGIELGAAIRAKFNEVSDRVNFPEKL